MNNLSTIALVELLKFGLQEWASRAGKGADWIPTKEDWDALKNNVNLPLEVYEAHGRAVLGLPPE